MLFANASSSPLPLRPLSLPTPLDELFSVTVVYDTLIPVTMLCDTLVAVTLVCDILVVVEFFFIYFSHPRQTRVDIAWW